jgi:hypothetical protein
VWLTVPIRHSGRSGQSLLEVEIDERQNWRRKHVTSVAQLYAKAPHLPALLPHYQEVIERPWTRLMDLDLAVIAWLAGALGIATPCHRASDLAIGGDRNERLLNLCRRFGATRYLSGNAARDYLDADLFGRAGVEVAWHDYRHPVYSQLHGDFVPYLSVLDLMLCTGPQALTVLSPAPAE